MKISLVPFKLLLVALLIPESAPFVHNCGLVRGRWSPVTMPSFPSSSGRKMSYRLQSIMEETCHDSDSETDVDIGDFEKILDCVYIYEKTYGDLEIPVKFEVPTTDPWPKHLHGLRLGKRLEKLLSTPEFFSEYPDHVDSLRKLGLTPDVSVLVDDWAMIIKALDVYKSIYGNLRVPSKFSIPESEPWPRLARGLKLGVRVAAIRSAGRYVKEHPERKEELDALGFEWRLREVPQRVHVSDEDFERITMALQTFKEIYGDLVVPEGFIVPSESAWPEKTHGLELGKIAGNIRNKDRTFVASEKRETRLVKLGFSWEETGRALYSKRRFELIYDALLVYKELNGDLLVPQAFVVPDGLPWPEDAWSLKLGARVNAMRSQGTLVASFPERRQRLNDLGFVWELPASARRKRASEVRTGIDVNAALATQDAAAASASAGIRPVTDDNDEEDYGGDRDRINSLGIPGRTPGSYRAAASYDPTRMFEPVAYREVAAEAMRDYLASREMSEDPDIRQHAHFEGHLSPQTFHKIITRTIPEEDVKQMRKLGYRILEFGPFHWSDVLEALECYKEAEGHCNVPLDFTIGEEELADSDHWGFDPRWEDMTLGHAVASIRAGDAEGLEDTNRKKALDALGFEWGDKSRYLRFRFLPMILGLKIYKHLYGFPLPQYDFRVPDEPQWPHWMVNMPLGEWAAVARIQQNILREDWPDRVHMLNAMDFLWWLPPGDVPSKYYRALR